MGPTMLHLGFKIPELDKKEYIKEKKKEKGVQIV